MIVERYIRKETIEFCSNYLSESDSIGITESRHDERYGDRGTQGLNVKIVDWDVVLQTHLYILNNSFEVQPYLSAHKSLIKEKFPRMSENLMLTEHNKTFINWFNERVSKYSSASETIKCMSLKLHVSSTLTIIILLLVS